MAVYSDKIKFGTKGHTDIIDITNFLDRKVQDSAIKNGLLNVFVPGATGALTTIEYEPGLVADLKASFDRFRPVYLRYESELSGVDFREMAKLNRVDADSLTAEQADRLILDQLENAKSLIALREKYYKEFKTVLSPQQIIKLYQTEADMRKKVTQEMKRRRMMR